MNALLTSPEDSYQSSRPVIFEVYNESGVTGFNELVNSIPPIRIVDTYDEQLYELFETLHPELALGSSAMSEFDSFRKRRLGKRDERQHGSWAYFPWLATCVHILPEEEYQLVRTARNRELIKPEEQSRFYEYRIGVAGLSVGNSIVAAIVLSGGARRICLADFDTLELSNLNRIRSGVDSLGLSKIEVAMRQIYLLNPYANITVFPAGLSKENLHDFFNDINMVIDELDSMSVKYLIRMEAKKRRIPVLMATDNGESGIIDVERYDIDSDLEPFHGRIKPGGSDSWINLDKRETGTLIAQHVGAENQSERMTQSHQLIGSSIASWPQLGTTVLLNGAAIAHCVLKIANGQNHYTGRAIVSLDSMFTD